MEWYWWILMFYCASSIVVCGCAVIGSFFIDKCDFTGEDLIYLILAFISGFLNFFVEWFNLLVFIAESLPQDFLDKVLIKAKMEEK